MTLFLIKKEDGSPNHPKQILVSIYFSGLYKLAQVIN